MTEDERERPSSAHRWLMEVAHIDGDTRLVEELLARGFDLRLVEHEGFQCLAGPLLDSSETDAEVFRKASDVGRSIAQASQHQPALQMQLKLGTRVFDNQPSGQRVHHFVALTGVAAIVEAGDVCVAFGTVGTPDEATMRRLAEEQAEREHQARLADAITRARSIYRSPDALQVQRLLAGDLSPQAMGVLSDVLEANTKGSRTSLGGSRNQWELFDRSINHSSVFGDKARHGKSNTAPPANPMSLQECQAFIRAAAEVWLKQVGA